MNTLKVIIFTNALTLFITLVIHIGFICLGKDFSLILYPTMCGIITIVILFTIYIAKPIAEWWFKI